MYEIFPNFRFHLFFPMKFQEIIKRLTGFSTPIFGVSWDPSESEREVAKRVIAELEDRRVLYNPTRLEDPHHCIQSIIEIRHLLTNEIGNLNQDSQLSKSLKAMRAVCRKFLNNFQDDKRTLKYGYNSQYYGGWVFISSLGELRGVFGIHLAQIAAEYGLDIEDDLSTILPEVDE